MTDSGPSFFFPGAASPAQAEAYLDAIVRFAGDFGFRTTGRRVFHLEYDEEGEPVIEEVGQLEGRDGYEVVVAILETDKVFLVVTASRGFQRGVPIVVGRDEARDVVDFGS
jgi:hypothetical protein